MLGYVTYSHFNSQLHICSCYKYIIFPHCIDMGQRKNIDVQQKVALRLKEVRNQKGMSLQEVCDETGINVARIEAIPQNVTIDTLSNLCEYYDISLKEFFNPFI